MQLRFENFLPKNAAGIVKSSRTLWSKAPANIIAGLFLYAWPKTCQNESTLEFEALSHWKEIKAILHSFLSGVRLFDSGMWSTDAWEFLALKHKLESFDIYSNSWGPGDIGWEVKGPGPLASKALERGITTVLYTDREWTELLPFCRPCVVSFGRCSSSFLLSHVKAHSCGILQIFGKPPSFEAGSMHIVCFRIDEVLLWKR